MHQLRWLRIELNKAGTFSHGEAIWWG